jgi:CPA2 family monovalent cation:H+ antiporter-2
MFETGYFSDVLWFLFAAVLVSAISARLKSSPVLGYLFAGAAMGPWALRLIENVENSRSISELGLVFLFFAIGLGMSIERLLILRRYLFGLGTLQVAVTCAVLVGGFKLFGFSMLTSIIVASSLALSSTAIVLQLLSESNEMSVKHGRVTFSVLLLQDLAAILMLVLVEFLKPKTESDAETITLMYIALNILKSAGGVVLMVVLGRFVIRPIFRFLGDTYQPDLFMAFTLLVILGTSALALKVGVSIEFAAFTIGLLLSDSEFRNKVENVIRSFRGLFLGLFFMGIGMSINITMFGTYFWPIIGLTFVFIPIKFLIMYLSSRSFGLSHWVSIRVSTYIAPGGEFAFVILGPAIAHHLISPEIGNIAVLAAAISMMFTPLLDRLVRWLMPVEEEHDEVIEEEIG